jgi:8-oxo-dGTP diphosphatase
MVDRDSLRAIRVVAALIARDDRYLITQRRPTAVLPLMWEFPGGRVEPGETDQHALAREIRHRLDVEVAVGKLISYVQHPYEKYRIDLHLYECSLVRGEPREANVQAFRWVRSDEFDHYSFTPADEASMAILLGIE